MRVHRWGVIPYEAGRERMERLHRLALRDGEDHLALCTHPAIYTVGRDDEGEWGVPVLRCDRGGSVTCHSEGQAIFYFCFQVPDPPRFYRRVHRAFEAFFAEALPTVAYDPKRPGWYVNDRKIASLGFRYKGGVSLHGVALNVDVDLAFHNRVAPCGLEGITATSLAAEGVRMGMEEVRHRLVLQIARSFDTSVEEG
ncbi:lipoyl protein ligase domain-containing protein [Hydrogenimonas sp.]